MRCGKVALPKVNYFQVLAKTCKNVCFGAANYVEKRT